MNLLIQTLRARLVEVERERDTAQEIAEQHWRLCNPGDRMVGDAKALHALGERLLAAESRASAAEGALRAAMPLIELYRHKLLSGAPQLGAREPDVSDLPEVLTRASRIAQCSAILATLSGLPPLASETAAAAPGANEPRSCKCGEVTFPDCTFKFWRDRNTGYHSPEECKPIAPRAAPPTPAALVPKEAATPKAIAGPHKEEGRDG